VVRLLFGCSKKLFFTMVRRLFGQRGVKHAPLRRRSQRLRVLISIIIMPMIIILMFHQGTRASGHVQFIALVDLDKGSESCLGIVTADFNGFHANILTYDSETKRDLPSRLRKAISRSNRPSSMSLNIVVVFEAHDVMFELEDAKGSILQRFSSFANYDSIYTPAPEPSSTYAESLGVNLLDCFSLSGYNFVGSASVVDQYLSGQETEGNTLDRDCVVQYDYEKMFFKKVVVDMHLSTPLTTIHGADSSQEITNFLRRRYPSSYLAVAEKLINSRQSVFTAHARGMNCYSKLSLSDSNSTYRTLSVYWINLRQSHDRRRQMEAHLQSLSEKYSFRKFRMEATDKDDVRERLEKYSLPPWLRVMNFKVTYEDHLNGIYSYHELACLISHILTIERAYKAGEELAVIIEDDTRFQEDFFRLINGKVDSAPVDWEILQLYTVNEEVALQLRKVRQDNFVKWFPNHWSTAAYIVNRKGMKKLIHAFDVLTGAAWSTGDKEKLAHVLVADEFLYFHAVSYTATFYHVGSVPSPSTIQESGISVQRVNRAYVTKTDCDVLALPPCPASVMLLVSARVESVTQAVKFLLRTQRNVAAVETCVLHVEASLTFVVRSQNLADVIGNRVVSKFSKVKNGVRITVVVWASRYNKFWFVRNFIPFMSSFEKILMLDGDIVLTGFPVSDFFQSSYGSVISGALRRGLQDNILAAANNPVRQWFAAFSGGDWLYHIDPQIRELEVTFMEMYFSLLDGQFAHWFFSQILAEEFLHENKNTHLQRMESDYGPDVLWCGAARDWIELTQSSKRPCFLSLFMLLHLDERSIPNQSFDAASGSKMKTQIQRQERKPLDMYKSSFDNWVRFSEDFRNFLGGQTSYGDSFLKRISALQHKERTRCLVGKP